MTKSDKLTVRFKDTMRSGIVRSLGHQIKENELEDNGGTVRKCVEYQQENMKGRYLVDILDRVMLFADSVTLG